MNRIASGRAAPELQLFCLPYSGASATLRHVPEWLQLHPLELPGRGLRFGEPQASDISVLPETLVRQIKGQEVMAELRKFQGTPEHVLANDELLSLALPVLRADFLMCGRYRYRLRPQLRCHLHVLSGKNDDVSAAQLTAWADETSGKFSLDMFDGGHFFIHDQEPAVLRVLSQRLAADLQQHDAAPAPMKALGS